MTASTRREACPTSADAAGAATPIAIAELLFQDLAGPSLGELTLNEFHGPGQFVVGQPAPAEFNQLIRRNLAAGDQGNAGVDGFSPLRVWYSYNCCFLNRRVFIQRSFHLGGEYILTACHYHVFL